MRCVGCLVMLSALFAWNLASTGSAQNNAQQELVQLERDWCTALIKKDETLLRSILSDDYTSVSSRGTPSTKAGDLADLKGSDGMTSCVDDNVKVRVYGDVAIVTAHGRRSGIYKGASFKDREIYYTDTFVKKNGRWACVASQGTLVAAQQK
jgi:ketosteroid isomerase-like protein